MNITFPLIALAAAAAATLFVDKNRDEPRGDLARSVFSPIRLIVMLAVPAIAALIAMWLGKKADGLMMDAIGIGVGVLAAIVAECLDRGPEAVGPLAIAVAATAAIQFISKESLEGAQLGLAVGFGLAAWMLSVGGRGRGASRAAILAIAAIGGDVLGAHVGDLGTMALSGTAFGLVVVVAGLVSSALLAKAEQALLKGGLTVALLAAGAFAVARGTGQIGEGWIIFLVAVVTGVVVHLLVGPDEKPDSFRFLLASLIWLGAATASFGQGHDLGMATALIGAASVPLILGNPRALLTLGPLTALVMYRIFREMYTADTKSIDIGQHYALIGLGAGIVLPLLPIEWSSTNRSEGERGAAASLLWACLLVATPILAAIVLGPKGAIGFIFGLGFASVVDGLRGGTKVESLGLSVAISASTVVTYGWLDHLLDLERKAKQQHLITAAVVVAIVGLAIVALSIRKPAASSGSNS